MQSRKSFEHRVLIVDDELLNIEVAAAFLEELGDIKIHFARDAESALAGFKRHTFDLILLDINLPDIDGFEVCRRIKKLPDTADVPVVFMTSEHEIDVVARAFEAGGVDYIPKPFSGEEFKARVKTHLRLRKTVLELREKQRRLADLSVTDPLSRCYNHFYFYTRLKQMLEKGQRGWLLRVHVQRLEKVDLLMGYRRADAVLRETAKILREQFAQPDLCARLYGAHFVILSMSHDREALEENMRGTLKAFSRKRALRENVEIAMVAMRMGKNESPAGLIGRSLRLLMKRGSRLYLVEE